MKSTQIIWNNKNNNFCEYIYSFRPTTTRTDVDVFIWSKGHFNKNLIGSWKWILFIDTNCILGKLYCQWWMTIETISTPQICGSMRTTICFNASVLQFILFIYFFWKLKNWNLYIHNENATLETKKCQNKKNTFCLPKLNWEYFRTIEGESLLF